MKLLLLTLLPTLALATFSSGIGPVSSHGNFFKSILSSSFDARDYWPECEQFIGKVFDQGCCALSYAIAPTSVMSDRTCINTETMREYSANYVAGCCETCAESVEGSSCREVGDGDAWQVWRYWIRHGITSEQCGAAGERDGCYNPKCLGECQQDDVKLAFDLVQGEYVYSVGSSVRDIQAEILTFGPVQSTIGFHDDFTKYEGGVYNSVGNGSLLGEHHVKIIGWGQEDKEDYWLGVNSFGKEWGIEGLFKILRGVDFLGIESNVVAGLPFENYD
ncbi:cathepsin B-like cysteine proteinase 6 [Uranotaenia lowii]|uniref:cathepsin B-like cysteine proteinase 6 n=1 Tax=Uranotaenia lowii TaxID=190385 RepID=UPI0024797BE3|nr:cathepsin B-like cysteine proteinase 6 [Uranotaenia lowii]